MAKTNQYVDLDLNGQTLSCGMIDSVSTRLRGYINGLLMTNNASDTSNDIDFATGVAWVSDRLVDSTSTITKRLDAAWASGAGNGGLFSGSKANSTTYHCFIMRNDTSGAIDFGFDTSLTGANKPSGWSVRQFSSIITDGSGNIRQFSDYGDRVEWKTPIKDVQQAGVSTSGELLSLTVPNGIKVQPLAKIYWLGSSSSYLYFSSPDSDNLTADFAEGRLDVQNNSVDQTGQINYTTNTSRQIRVRSSANNAGDTLRILTYGYQHSRGRN